MFEFGGHAHDQFDVSRNGFGHVNNELTPELAVMRDPQGRPLPLSHPYMSRDLNHSGTRSINDRDQSPGSVAHWSGSVGGGYRDRPLQRERHYLDPPEFGIERGLPEVTEIHNRNLAREGLTLSCR